MYSKDHFLFLTTGTLSKLIEGSQSLFPSNNFYDFPINLRALWSAISNLDITKQITFSGNFEYRRFFAGVSTFFYGKKCIGKSISLHWSMWMSSDSTEQEMYWNCESNRLQGSSSKYIRQLMHIFQHVVLKCHLRLAELYSQLNDDDSEETARRAASRLTQEMQLFCNFCGQRYGLKDESLQALRCSHIFHEK